MDYKGIKIYNKITIVERTEVIEGGYTWEDRTVNQGYVVDTGNKKMLDTALRWAEWTYYDKSLLGGKYYWHKEVTDDMRKAYDASAKKIDGVVHEYDNGSFIITLSESAAGSSQGGKLSFWNCIITAPDGNSFLVGINSELLLHLLMSTTFINGTCQEKVWLGRVGGTQVGVFTESMEDFKQAKLDEEQRTAVKNASNKYVPGDIVGTLKEKQLYLGSIYKYYSFEQGYRYCDKYIVIYDKPKLVHIFRGFYKHWDSDVEELNSYFTETLTKPKRLVLDHMDLDESVADYISRYTKQKFDESLDDKNKYSWYSAENLLMYGTNDTCDKEAIKKSLSELYDKCGRGYWSINSEYKFLTEEEYKEMFK